MQQHGQPRALFSRQRRRDGDLPCDPLFYRVHAYEYHLADLNQPVKTVAAVGFRVSSMRQIWGQKARYVDFDLSMMRQIFLAIS